MSADYWDCEPDQETDPEAYDRWAEADLRMWFHRRGRYAPGHGYYQVPGERHTTALEYTARAERIRRLMESRVTKAAAGDVEAVQDIDRQIGAAYQSVSDESKLRELITA